MPSRSASLPDVRTSSSSRSARRNRNCGSIACGIGSGPRLPSESEPRWTSSRDALAGDRRGCPGPAANGCSVSPTSLAASHAGISCRILVFSWCSAGPCARRDRRAFARVDVRRTAVRSVDAVTPRTIPEKERAGPPRRILYALGPGDVVHAYREWRAGREFTAETSITYSSQFFDYCLQTGTEAFAVSSHPRREVVRDGLFVVENRPKRFANAGGALYHLSQFHYAASILWTALRQRPGAVIVDSGTTHWFLLAPLRIARIPVIASMHNALWPPGFPPLRTAR